MSEPPNPAPIWPVPVWSIVVPVRDEAGNIGPLIAEIHAAMAGREAYEIIYVDDGSKDSTAAELAAALVHDDVKLRTKMHYGVCGQSQALITGVVNARGGWIITLDGDGQNDPADIAKLIEARDAAGHLAENTLFIGHRALRRDSLSRRLASRFARCVRAVVLGDATPDSSCGLRLIHRDLFQALPRFDALHRFMPVLVVREGGRVVSIPISHRPRRQGRSKYGIWKRGLVGVLDLAGMLWLTRRHTQPPSGRRI